MQTQWLEGTRAPTNYPLILIFCQVTHLINLFTGSEVSNNTSDLEKMQLEDASLEDQDWQNNVTITGITTSKEGGDAITFLQDMLPKWIPSLGDAKIQIERTVIDPQQQEQWPGYHDIQSAQIVRRSTLPLRGWSF